MKLSELGTQNKTITLTASVCFHSENYFPAYTDWDAPQSTFAG